MGSLADGRSGPRTLPFLGNLDFLGVDSKQGIFPASIYSFLFLFRERRHSKVSSSSAGP